MPAWTVAFLILVMISAVLGFGVVGGTAGWIVKVLFSLFMILLLVSLLRHSEETI